MLAFPLSVFGKPRGLGCAIAIAFVAGTAVGWGAALPSAPDAVIADTRAETWPVRPDFDLVFATLDAPLRKQDRAKPASVKPDSTKIVAVNFEETFASLVSQPRDNTPSRREKLRN